jgi:Fur family transcriptional regulator, ferric uptake regulator
MKKSRETKQKSLMSKALESSKNFFTAEDLYKKIKSIDKSIGIATVYRFLKDLKRENKIFTYTCNRRTLYSKENKTHCHFICDKTGKIIHFDIKDLNFLNHIKEKIPGEITSFQLEIHGICENCSD